MLEWAGASGVVIAAGGWLDAAESPFGELCAPDMLVAYAVMCVRTSISFARVAASSATLSAAFEREPDVPTAPLEPAPDVPVAAGAALVSLAVRSARILSIAATSVPQLAPERAGVPLLLCAAPVVLPFAAVLEAPRSSALKWRFSSANCLLACPVIAVTGMLLSASFA